MKMTPLDERIAEAETASAFLAERPSAENRAYAARCWRAVARITRVRAFVRARADAAVGLRPWPPWPKRV